MHGNLREHYINVTTYPWPSCAPTIQRRDLLCVGFLPALAGFPSPISRGGNPVCWVKIFLPLRRSCACFVFFLRDAL